MKKILLVIVAACCMLPMAYADDAAKQAKAEQLIELMHMDKLMAQMTDMVKTQMQQSIDQAVDGGALTDKQKTIQADFRKKLIDMIMGSMSWAAMKPDFVKVYVDNFTDQEMDGMIAFYSSPVGQSVLTKMPQISAASMKLAQSRMVNLEPQLKTLMDDYTAQMKAASK